eukprot:GHVQ01015198.1.p2 GENE.GHVQ01015198.1~~GHVQ01015198.1.p2  ORF type:complete len:100 (+),score=3.31 GHVQ01015198.1:495-794(+)
MQFFNCMCLAVIWAGVQTIADTNKQSHSPGVVGVAHCTVYTFNGLLCTPDSHHRFKTPGNDDRAGIVYTVYSGIICTRMTTAFVCNEHRLTITVSNSSR